ncbi:hypothetical protein ACI3PL_16600, partial [Lacticaseibacillus paracasei]
NKIDSKVLKSLIGISLVLACPFILYFKGDIFFIPTSYDFIRYSSLLLWPTYYDSEPVDIRSFESFEKESIAVQTFNITPCFFCGSYFSRSIGN